MERNFCQYLGTGRILGVYPRAVDHGHIFPSPIPRVWPNFPLHAMLSLAWMLLSLGLVSLECWMGLIDRGMYPAGFVSFSWMVGRGMNFCGWYVYGLQGAAGSCSSEPWVGGCAAFRGSVRKIRIVMSRLPMRVVCCQLICFHARVVAVGAQGRSLMYYSRLLWGVHYWCLVSVCRQKQRSWRTRSSILFLPTDFLISANAHPPIQLQESGLLLCYP